jgi:hypothetical protein
MCSISYIIIIQVVVIILIITMTDKITWNWLSICRSFRLKINYRGCKPLFCLRASIHQWVIPIHHWFHSNTPLIPFQYTSDSIPIHQWVICLTWTCASGGVRLLCHYSNMHIASFLFICMTVRNRCLTSSSIYVSVLDLLFHSSIHHIIWTYVEHCNVKTTWFMIAQFRFHVRSWSTIQSFNDDMTWIIFVVTCSYKHSCFQLHEFH